MLVCQSFSKNMGLYGERVGALHIVCNPERRDPIRSHLIRLQRAEISNPPLFGARIVTEVLTSPDLRQLWQEDLVKMSSRIKQMRQMLYEELLALKTPGSWKHVVEQIGMFSYTGLTEEQVGLLIAQHHIYLMRSGRISICGLTTENVKYVASAIHDVVNSTAR